MQLLYPTRESQNLNCRSDMLNPHNFSKNPEQHERTGAGLAALAQLATRPGTDLPFRRPVVESAFRRVRVQWQVPDKTPAARRASKHHKHGCLRSPLSPSLVPKAQHDTKGRVNRIEYLRGTRSVLYSAGSSARSEEARATSGNRSPDRYAPVTTERNRYVSDG